MNKEVMANYIGEGYDTENIWVVWNIEKYKYNDNEFMKANNNDHDGFINATSPEYINNKYIFQKEFKIIFEYIFKKYFQQICILFVFIFKKQIKNIKY